MEDDGVSNALQRVPKWAWFASAGVAGGVLVMRMRGNQGSEVDKNPDDNTSVADYGLTAAPIGTGVVSAGQGVAGYGDATAASGFDYAGFTESLADFATSIMPAPIDIGSIIESVEQGNVGVIGAIGGLPGFAGGGGAPNSSATTSPVVVNVAAPVAPAPAPAPVAAPQARTRTVDNGKRGADRRVWCMCGDHKVADGACWAENHACV